MWAALGTHGEGGAVPSFQAAPAKRQRLQTAVLRRPRPWLDQPAAGAFPSWFLAHTADLGKRGLRLPREGTDRMPCPDQLRKMLQGPSTPLSARIPQQPKGSRLTRQAVGDSLEPGEAGHYRTPGEACL